jgi:hypothetical protein
MVSFTVGIAAGIGVLALLCWCVACGFRDGDRLADATVSAVLRASGQPDEPRPVIVATVVNPSGTAVLTAAIGQSAGRLCLHRLRVAGAGNAVSAPSTVFSPETPGAG